MMECNRRVLSEYDKKEGISLLQAAFISGRTVETVRTWVATHDLDRKVGGQWAIGNRFC